MLQWLQQQGCTAQKLDRKAIEKLLDAKELPPPVRRVLELRLGGAQAAVKKIDALLARAGDDDRVRGAFKFHGAATGRWAGEGFQPQNLKRPVVEDLDAAIAAVATGSYAHVKTLYPRPLSIIGDCSRSMICAAPGRVLIGADFSAVESRVLAWVAGEAWKLDSYRRFDATRDPRDEPYCETACRIFGVPSGTYTKDSPERGVGKTCDLAFGYMGGLNAWRKFQPDKFSDAEVETFKAEWRAAHPATVKFWHNIDRAAVLAVRERGQIVRCGRIDLKYTGAFLQLKLPSGRKLSYPQPRIIKDERNKHRVVFADNAAGQFVGLPPRPRRLRRLVDREHRFRHRARSAGRRHAAHRSRRLSDRVACARRDRVRGADWFRQHRRIHPSHDAQTVLGAGAADRSQCLERPALLQMKETHLSRVG